MGTLEKQVVANMDFEVRSLDTASAPSAEQGVVPMLKYAIAGAFFGILLTKAEVIDWFRIQEMFRFESFHMYGVIGSAVVVGLVSVQLIKRFQTKTIGGAPITFQAKPFNKGVVYGGLLFGIGWAITGACPGPLFAQIGTGSTVVVVTLMSAVVGTYTYGLLRERLPH